MTFCDVYLNGPEETWSIICPDAKYHDFKFVDRTGTIIDDPGGTLMYDSFRKSYQDTLLRMSSKELAKVTSRVNMSDYEKRRDYLMDDFDLQSVQTKAFDLSSIQPRPFIKKLHGKIKFPTTSGVFIYIENQQMLTAKQIEFNLLEAQLLKTASK